MKSYFENRGNRVKLSDTEIYGRNLKEDAHRVHHSAQLCGYSLSMYCMQMINHFRPRMVYSPLKSFWKEFFNQHCYHATESVLSLLSEIFVFEAFVLALNTIICFHKDLKIVSSKCPNPSLKYRIYLWSVL